MQNGIEFVAHIIQIALTPIFLLVGVAGLLNVFSTRHSYVTQHVDQSLAAIRDKETVDQEHLQAQLEYLRRRSGLLDVAVVLGILAGSSTCLAAMLLFVSELGDNMARFFLFSIFGAALGFTVAALGVFAAEMTMSGQSLRAKIVWMERVAASKPAKRE